MPTIREYRRAVPGPDLRAQEVLPGKVWQGSALEVMVVPQEWMGTQGTARSLVWIGHKV